MEPSTPPPTQPLQELEDTTPKVLEQTAKEESGEISSPDFSSEQSEESESESSSYERDDSPPRRSKLRSGKKPHKATKRSRIPEGFERSRCRAHHVCTNSDCWTGVKDKRIIWDRQRYKQPFFPTQREEPPRRDRRKY